ncbi:MAG TPA: LuxR C-terminal-related transcriptional regulator [Mycobacteriales bacterium]|nr:LuxR C-terminal-related transcriptional regulator [Mycobacteriales bacterium]
MGKQRGRPRHPDVLTPAEWQVADAVRHGLGNRQIARRRGISPDAVKFHLANTLAKLGLADRGELRRWCGVPSDSALAQRDPRRGPPATMSPDLRLGPLGQVSRHVRDLPRAVHWYGEILGLPHLYTYGDLAFFDCGGVRLFLSASADEVVAPDSVLYFRVPDIRLAYEQLGSRGVEFSGAPHMIFRHESGLEEWMAFFVDPDGRPLAIMAQVQAGPGPEPATADPAD